MSRPDNGDGTYGSKPAHKCSTVIDGYEFSVELNLTHPFLAEYEKIVIVMDPDGAELATERFIDPGGLASFYVFRDEQTITFVDGLADGISILKNINSAKRNRHNGLMDKIESDSIGRCMFSQSGYTYLSKKEIAALTPSDSAE
ncbi:MULTISPECIES: hypothetical protein [Aphanothece]|uniref:hypothetical protein n=1 Tax=Aphanothece TaxID=1121 RepID=UPI0039855CB8